MCGCPHVVERLAGRSPISVRHRLIVGSSGREDDDFEATLRVVDELRCRTSRVPYSDRKGTEARGGAGT